MKQVKHINENQLRNIVTESVKAYIQEMDNLTHRMEIQHDRATLRGVEKDAGCDKAPSSMEENFQEELENAIEGVIDNYPGIKNCFDKESLATWMKEIVDNVISYKF